MQTSGMGQLGIMIPPSINLIVYGFLTQTSIPRLFLAGLIPGLALAVGFMVITIIICMIRPSLGGPRRVFPFPKMLRALVQLGPIILLFTMIIGTIYKGWATPTEAAAVGVAGANCRLSWMDWDCRRWGPFWWSF